MSLFRPFYDTSFTDHRQVRILVQELTRENADQRSTIDFHRFCTHLNSHKQNTYEQYKVEYCFVDAHLAQCEQNLNDIQFYRRSFASIFFARCQTSDELRLILDRYAKIKSTSSNIFTHLFVRYRSNSTADDDDFSKDEENFNGNQDDLDFIQTYRPSISSMISLESTRSTPSILTTMKTLESLPSEDSETAASESASLNNSLTCSSSFSAIDADGNETTVERNENEPIALILQPSPEPKKSRTSLIRQKTLPSPPIFDSYESDLHRAFHRLETAMKKTQLESRRSETNFTAIDSQLADIRLMIECEKDCSFFEPTRRTSAGSIQDRQFKTVMNDCDQYILKTILEHYINSLTHLTQENAKTKLAKKILEARTIKRKADCCLLLGSTERAYQEYRRAAEALKSQNDLLWSAAALEGRVAASYNTSVQKPKRQLQKTFSFLSQNSLTKRLSMAKLLTRSNTPIHLQDKIENALQIYSSSSRSLFNRLEYQLELDACIRWCSLLMEQPDLQKYRNSIEDFINQISKLGANIENPLYTIYLNAYAAESYTFIGMKRKGALFYRSAGFAGLSLLAEEEKLDEDHREIAFFDSLIKNARTGYGIDDNRVIFPLIQKTVLNESIQISLRRNDHATILENVHFAIESLMEYMDDVELEGLLEFLNIGDQTINCSYCAMPRLKSLDLLPLPEKLKAWRAEAKSNIFLYRPPVSLPNHQKSLHRKVDFFWVRNQPVQIALVVENYLPASMIIKQLEFICEIALETKKEKKYQIAARTTKRLLIDCIPKETGRLKIQGLRYRLWSTFQEFQFVDFFSIRHCTCSVDVVAELPIITVEHLFVNEKSINLNSNENSYVVDVHRGENIQLNFDLINSSADYSIETLNVDVYVSGFNLTEFAKINDYSLPFLFQQRIQMKIDLTQVCERRLSRSTLSSESLTMEIRIKYSNNDLSSDENYYRRETISIRWNFLPSIQFELNEIHQDDDNSKFLISSIVENCLDEEISFDDQTIEAQQSSLISTKHSKFHFEQFPSDHQQLVQSIRKSLPKYISYRTVQSNKNLRVSIDWSTYSSTKLIEHFNNLVQSPFQCFWHFHRQCQTIEIHLCLQTNSSALNKLEFSFVKTNECHYLNSNKIIFNDLRPFEYQRAERLVVISISNEIDLFSVDVKINEMFWQRITLTIE